MSMMKRRACQKGHRFRYPLSVLWRMPVYVHCARLGCRAIEVSDFMWETYPEQANLLHNSIPEKRR